jgi:hypothetical protein
MMFIKPKKCVYREWIGLFHSIQALDQCPTYVLAELENIYTDHTDSTDRLIYKSPCKSPEFSQGTQ